MAQPTANFLTMWAALLSTASKGIAQNVQIVKAYGRQTVRIWR